MPRNSSKPYKFATVDTWTVQSILEWIEGYLRGHGDENPRISARWLVSDALGVAPIELYTDLERPITNDEREVLRGYTTRRGAGEPLQYITGTSDFRFLTLFVEPGVLIPRPETEVLVSLALDELFAAFPDARRTAADVAGPPLPVVAVDVCTGSGNIACSLASEIPSTHVWACDIDAQAIDLAARNVAHLKLDDAITVVQGDLAQPLMDTLAGSVHILVSNPPYIPTSVMSQLPKEVRAWEPDLALDGGVDGLDMYRKLLCQAKHLLCPGGVLAVELHETCLESAVEAAQAAGFVQVRFERDLAQRPRVLVARMPASS